MDLKKKVLSISKDIFRETAKISLETMSATSMHYSKEKGLSEDQREKYAEIASSMKQWGDKLNNHVEENTDDCFSSSSNYPSDNLNSEKVTSNLDIVQKILQQEQTCTPDLKYGNFQSSIEESQWVTLGYLPEIDLANVPEEVGIIKFLLNGEVVYLIRALEAKKGGIQYKLSQICKNLKYTSSSTLLKNLKSNAESVKVEILQCGKSVDSLNMCRNLEKFFLKKYDPLWMR